MSHGVEIKWAKDFLEDCSRAEKVLGYMPGGALMDAVHYLCDEDSGYSFELLAKIDEEGEVYIDFDEPEDFGCAPYYGRVDGFFVRKSNIMNWDEYYSYRRALRRLKNAAGN